VGAAGFLGALALPILLWHGVIAAIAAGFRLEPGYLITGWTPWVLMALGLACFVPIAIDDRRDPGRRFRTTARGAWFGWGTSLYVLGFGLATQVAQIAQGLSSA
jgi:hypothetical protein